MEPMAWIAIVIFTITILAVITQRHRRHGRRADRRRDDGVVRRHDRDRRVRPGRLERHGDPGQRLADRELLRQDRRAELAVGPGAQALGRPAGAARDHPVGARRHDLDVRRQRRRDPDDGAGGAAARPRAQDPGDAAGPDDRLLGELHGLGDAAGRPAAADAAQRRRRRVHGLLLAPGPAVVVPDPHRDVRDHAGGDVRLRLPRAPARPGRRREARHRDAHPEPAVRHRGRGVVPGAPCWRWRSARCWTSSSASSP